MQLRGSPRLSFCRVSGGLLLCFKPATPPRFWRWFLSFTVSYIPVWSILSAASTVNSNMILASESFLSPKQWAAFSLRNALLQLCPDTGSLQYQLRRHSSAGIYVPAVHLSRASLLLQAVPLLCAESWLPQCSHLLPSLLENCLWACLLFLFILITSKSREVSTLSMSHCSLGIFQRPFLTQNSWSFLCRKRLSNVLAGSPTAQSSSLPHPSSNSQNRPTTMFLESLGAGQLLGGECTKYRLPGPAKLIFFSPPRSTPTHPSSPQKHHSDSRISGLQLRAPPTTTSFLQDLPIFWLFSLFALNYFSPLFITLPLPLSTVFSAEAHWLQLQLLMGAVERRKW